MRLFALLAFVLFAGTAAADATRDAAVADPVVDAAFPTANKQVLVPSHGEEMNALFLLASGAGAKPTVVLLHGLPGNEQNLDLAQAMRRAGWNVLTLHYRGSWGSPGQFTIAHAVEDAAAAVAFLRQPEVAAKYAVDVRRIVIAGHSMGGFAAARLAASDGGLAGVILIDAWNVGADGQGLRDDPSTRAAFVDSWNDLGHALQGADAESITVEVEHAPADWDLRASAPALRKLPVLSLWADRGIAAQNAELAAAIREGENAGVTTQHFATDHAFSDHRIALARAVVQWLEGL